MEQSALFYFMNLHISIKKIIIITRKKERQFYQNRTKKFKNVKFLNLDFEKVYQISLRYNMTSTLKHIIHNSKKKKPVVK